ncbi:hypothetical protein BKA65DRAFT_149838 [Rhexocercosporidium sp. MPI-PUGE-AT-0058]|nr:hypothetical protein BKA65DRAFT_149838 [Rhexocercosporidium sp. MPI-PUGE-AT-0058]
MTRSNKLVGDLAATVPFKVLQQRAARQTIDHELYALFELVQMYKCGLCVDVRDKIFGLIGMCSQCCRDKIIVDYQRSPTDVCRTLLQHYLSLHSVHRINLKNFGSIELFTIVKEIIDAFKVEELGDQSSIGGVSFCEVFESPQERSITMMACLRRRPVHVDFTCVEDLDGVRSFHDFRSGKQHYTTLECSKMLPDDEFHGYWVCKVHRETGILLRQSQGRLYLVGITQNLGPASSELRSKFMDTDGLHHGEVDGISNETIMSKNCLYLDFSALSDLCKLFSLWNRPGGSSNCLLLGWKCLSCDFCWNKRYFFHLETKGVVLSLEMSEPL